MCTNFEQSAFTVLDAFKDLITLDEVLVRLRTVPLYLGGGTDVRKFVSSLVFEGYLQQTGPEYVLSEKGRKERENLSHIVKAA